MSSENGRPMPELPSSFTQMAHPAAGQMEDVSTSWSTSTTFFEYNDWGRISRTGHLLSVLSPLNSQKAIGNGPFVFRLPSVEELQARSLIDDELDAKSKEEDDEFYGIVRKYFQLIDFSGRHPNPLRCKEIHESNFSGRKSSAKWRPQTERRRASPKSKRSTSKRFSIRRTFGGHRLPGHLGRQFFLKNIVV